MCLRDKITGFEKRNAGDLRVATELNEGINPVGGVHVNMKCNSPKSPEEGMRNSGKRNPSRTKSNSTDVKSDPSGNLDKTSESSGSCLKNLKQKEDGESTLSEESKINLETSADKLIVDVQNSSVRNKKDVESVNPSKLNVSTKLPPFQSMTHSSEVSDVCLAGVGVE